MTALFPISTRIHQLIADSCTPTALFRRLRAKYPELKLLEGTEISETGSCFSYLLVDPISSLQLNGQELAIIFPGGKIQRSQIASPRSALSSLQEYMQAFSFEGKKAPQIANGFFGYINYDAVQCFEDIQLQQVVDERMQIPLLRYELYRHNIAINHIRNEVFLLTNTVQGEHEYDQSFLTELRKIFETALPEEGQFSLDGDPRSNMSDEEYCEVVRNCKRHIRRGDVFQIVPSRRFEQDFAGDPFQVYRALRVVNPSPYLFYFDYGAYQLFGSSPEAQIVVQNGRAEIHPIAGTCLRTGNEEVDQASVEKLCADPKENAEHVMLVDLARNDLSRHCEDVRVDCFREVHRYSHVFHLVSKVSGSLRSSTSALQVLADTFPAGTLSGAPKYRALELIDAYEKGGRGFYAGAVGFFDTQGGTLHAIIIRSFLAKNGTLFRQAGAGVVDDSSPEAELQEVNNKLKALQRALDVAAHPNGLFQLSVKEGV